ncbi:MAG: InlB B-repeat-containing protein, partial [Clostridia bacterium]|nr:InlB B-repeat-containing protein [Clostridia bacterium]
MSKQNMFLKRILCGIIAAAILSSFWMLPEGTSDVDYMTASAAQLYSAKSYSGESNVLSAAEYGSFGLVTDSPSEFDPSNTEHPMEDFEPVYLTELYVGDMNRTSNFKGSFRVMNNTSETSSSAFNFNNMDNDLIGNEVSFSDNYEEDDDPIEVQTHNACAIDYDGDGADEIIETMLYVNRDKGKDSFQDLRIYDLNEDTDKWQDGAATTYRLTNDDSDCGDFVWEITADTSKSYVALTAGDYDNDGKEEAAAYVPSKYGDNACIIIFEVNADKSLSEKDRIYVSELNNGKSNKFNMRYNDWHMPVVSLYTTSISGQDDLVINISNARDGDCDDYGHSSAMGIYHCGSNGQMETRYLDTNMTYGSNRMRFSSSVDADVNGNGVEELIVGGYINNDWDDNSDKGSISDSKNFIQIITWNTSSKKYEKVWDSPKQVEAHGDLKVSEAMMEPAAIAAAKLHAASNSDSVFLEGVVFKFSGADSSGSSEKNILSAGSFVKEKKISLGGDNNAFISNAYGATFSSASSSVEQIVVLAGDHVNLNDDNIYYDIIWIWEESSAITSSVTNNDYINKKNEDDDGTFISICPIDSDQDTVYVEYTGKEYGWSAPELLTVLQSPPYWKELDYDVNPGTVAFEVTYGDGSGIDSDWGVELGLALNVTGLAGVGFMGNNGMFGGGFGFSLMGGYIGNRSTATSYTKSWKYEVTAGEDYAVIFAVPIVYYKYNIWVPEGKADEAFIASYEELYGETCPYKVGDLIGGELQECSISVQLEPTFSAITLEEYNKLVTEFTASGKLTNIEPITEDMIAKKTIGDPSTYPESEEELKLPGNVVEDSMNISKSVTVDVGGGVTSLSYSVEESVSKAHGFHVDLTGDLYVAGKTETSIWFASETSGQIGLTLAAGGGAVWVESDSRGLSFSAAFTNMPEGTDEDYKYSTKMAVYQLDINKGGNGDDTSDLYGLDDYPYVVGYTVPGISEDSVPPSLPVDLRVYAVTENEVILKWEEKDYRPADSYEVFIKDNLGNAFSIGTTEKTYFIATGLDPATEYEFAVKSYSGTRESVLSNWVTAVTKDDDVTMPYFTLEPKNVIYSVEEPPESVTLTSEAKTGEGMDDATLTYQWQVYVEDASASEGSWENISGATQKDYTLPQVPAELGKSYYRVIASQRKSSSVKSVISKTATVWVMEDDTYSTIHALIAELTLKNESDAVLKGDTYYLETGTKIANVEINLKNASGADTPVPSSGHMNLMRRNEDGTETLLGKGYIANGAVKLDIDVENLSRGTYELYAIYYGGSEGNNVYYTPACSNTVKMKLVDVYSVTYHLDGGLNSANNPGVLTSESAEIELYPASKLGYTFEGWYWDETCLQPVTDNKIDPAALTGDINLYAEYKPIDYNISYVLDGGANSADNPSSYNFENVPIELAEPTKEGYSFTGWYTDETMTDSIDVIQKGMTGDITLYADFEPVDYFISYVMYGGVNSEKNPGTYNIESDTIELAEPTKEGYAFAGWYTDEAMTDGIEKIQRGSNGDITLYAKFDAIDYSITYVLDGGTNSADNPNLYNLENIPVVINDPEKDGYEFKGWYTDEDLTDKIERIVNGMAGDITLYAEFNVIDYSIKYVLDGGINSDKNPDIYNVESDTVELADPTKEGYDFAGWYTDEDLNDEIYEIESGTMGDITLYAAWDAVSDDGDGDNDGGNGDDQGTDGDGQGGDSSDSGDQGTDGDGQSGDSSGSGDQGTDGDGQSGDSSNSGDQGTDGDGQSGDSSNSGAQGTDADGQNPGTS